MINVPYSLSYVEFNMMVYEHTDSNLLIVWSLMIISKAVFVSITIMICCISP